MGTFSGVATELCENGMRLDIYIANVLKLLRRSALKSHFTGATVNKKKAKLSRIIKTGDTLTLQWHDEAPLSLAPENIPLDIIFENEDLIVINKAQGMVVHPGAGNKEHTLVNALLAYLNYTTPLSNDEHNEKSLRPFIVHRLDKDTSGVIIAAKNDDALFFLSEQFKNRKVKKTYTAISCGVPPAPHGIIENYITRDTNNRQKFSVSGNDNIGKLSISHYSIIKTFGAYALLLLHPATGRTHQLRVHLAHINCPILGDPIYNLSGKNFPAASLMLHARKLSITLPGEQSKTTFKAKTPKRFIEVIRKLETGNYL